MNEIVPVILSGGAGTRLWPLSRSLYPKQLLALHSERTMLQETGGRTLGEKFARPLIICNFEHRFIVAEQLRAVDVMPGDIILEPMGRNTAAAAAVASLRALENSPDSIILLQPSDHVISNTPAFHLAVKSGLQAARSGALVTFGVHPDGPETGYGYIRTGEAIDGVTGCFDVDRFVEKPDRETAAGYLADGRYVWNSGIFLFSAQSYLEELERLKPDILAACRAAIDTGQRDFDFFHLGEEEFGKAESASIDCAVMEHTASAVVVPVDMGWNDIGSWSALWDIGEKDDQQNVVQGDVVLADTQNSYIRSQKGLVVVIGLEDVVIANTEDAVLVSSKERVQDVKEIVDRLRQDDRPEVIFSHRIFRPWGWYETHVEGPGFLVKRITVNPGAKLSLQKHAYRAEHWVVVSGIATVTKGQEEMLLEANQSIYIPVGEIHRLANLHEDPVSIIEVQTGSYLSEDDIERLEDTYGRTSPKS
jgi:mannose-1-phosphate guanylyltransferase / mannose-6-phosphate isomerase